MRKRHDQARDPRSADPRRALWNVLLLVFLLGGLFCGYLFYVSIRDIVAYAELPFVVGGPANPGGPGGDGDSAPFTGPQLTQRVNILFLGLDRRDNDPGPWRTDTMILFSVDPISKTISMLSIPRDLYVPIPGFGEDRINAAHAYGDQFKLPGGGPELAKRTVQYNLGIPVDYFVRLDFRGFEKIIDQINGIDIDVPRTIVDTEYPTPDYGTMTVRFEAGRQHMDGKRALQYARTRHDSNDFDRSRRQQQVITAVRDKVLGLQVSLDRIPGLLRLLGDSVQTDMSLKEIYAVAQAARQMSSLNGEVIDETMTWPARTTGGAEVLLPDRDKIRVLVNRLFPSPTPSVSLGALGDPQKLAQEAARIEVQNGTQTERLATTTAAELRAAGYNVVRYGNADRSDYAETLIIYYVERKYTLASLKAQLKVPDSRITRQSLPPGSDVDIRVILGRDAATR